MIDLPADLCAGLPLPDTLREAILDAQRMKSFGAKRRQVQFIGKQMRRLTPEALDEVRAALRAASGRSTERRKAADRVTK